MLKPVPSEPWQAPEVSELEGLRALEARLHDRLDEMQPQLAAWADPQGPLARAVQRLLAAAQAGDRAGLAEALTGLQPATAALDDLFLARHLLDRLAQATGGGRWDVDFARLAEQQTRVQAARSSLRHAYAAVSSLLARGRGGAGLPEPTPTAATGLPLPWPVDVPNEQQACGRDAHGRPWTVYVHEGRLWARQGEGFALLPHDGLPVTTGALASPRERPQAVRCCWGDGPNLVVEDADGVLHYAKLLQGPAWVQWRGAWGQPPFARPQWIRRPDGARALAIAHRGPWLGWQDARGQTHDDGPMTTAGGVSTLYALEACGTRIRYSDPWHGGNLEQWLPSPLCGTVELLTLAACASTLMGLDASGRVWTRFYDLDQSGDNLTYAYTYATHGAPPQVWMMKDAPLPAVHLPAPPWQGHDGPRLHGGRLSGRIAIVLADTGEPGNGARELRLEGWHADGRAGYWHKPIGGRDWAFRAGEPVADAVAFVPRRVTPRASSRRRHRAEGLALAGCATQLDVALDHDPHDDMHPLTLGLWLPGEPLRTFHARLYTRARRRTEQGVVALGTLQVDPALLMAREPAARDLAVRVFHRQDTLLLWVHHQGDQIRLRPLAGIDSAHPCRQEIAWDLTA